ncbi:hypothetical protein F5880DRAFT_1616267 [Lentinula raphanica]|nr:hypothetical protein F5880DRAFT_1616267 [Lentinula raphanica]
MKSYPTSSSTTKYRLFHEVKPKRRAVLPQDSHLDDKDDSNEDEEEEDGKRTIYNAFTNACCDAFGRRNRSREPSTAYHSIHLIGEHLIRSQFNPDPNPPSLPPHPSNLNPLFRLDHVPGPHLKSSPGASEGSTHMLCTQLIPMFSRIYSVNDGFLPYVYPSLIFLRASIFPLLPSFLPSSSLSLARTRTFKVGPIRVGVIISGVVA